jgi:quercetin dioxygenase-like cupin family protein
MKNTIRSIAILSVMAISALPFFARPQEKKHPVPKIIKLGLAGQGYQRVLGGPPETSTMRSGLVVLAPGASVGKHNTDSYEEMIVVFEGRAEIRITGQPALQVEPGIVAYCSPHIEHDVFNVRGTPLRYLYIVAEGKE